jgi:DNA ligase N terminus
VSGTGEPDPDVFPAAAVSPPDEIIEAVPPSLSAAPGAPGGSSRKRRLEDEEQSDTLPSTIEDIQPPSKRSRAEDLIAAEESSPQKDDVEMSEGKAEEEDVGAASDDQGYCDLSNAVDQLKVTYTFDQKMAKLRAALADRSDSSGLFSDFATLCGDISAVSSYNAKTELISDFMKAHPDPYQKSKAGGKVPPAGPTACDHYILGRLLMCRDDRRIFGLKERLFARHLSRLLRRESSKNAANDSLSDTMYR